MRIGEYTPPYADPEAPQPWGAHPIKHYSHAEVVAQIAAWGGINPFKQEVLSEAPEDQRPTDESEVQDGTE